MSSSCLCCAYDTDTCNQDVDTIIFDKLDKEFLEKNGYCFFRLDITTELSSREVQNLKQTTREHTSGIISGSTVEKCRRRGDIDQRRHFMQTRPENLMFLDQTTND